MVTKLNRKSLRTQQARKESGSLRVCSHCPSLCCKQTSERKQERERKTETEPSQSRASKTLALVEVQLATAQEKMEKARNEMIAADTSANEAPQLAVQDTSIFADAEALVQALRLPP